MALIKCKECGKKISDKAEICIHCGATLHQSKSGDNYGNFRETKASSDNNRFTKEKIKKQKTRFYYYWIYGTILLIILIFLVIELSGSYFNTKYTDWAGKNLNWIITIVLVGIWFLFAIQKNKRFGPNKSENRNESSDNNRVTEDVASKNKRIFAHIIIIVIASLIIIIAVVTKSVPLKINFRYEIDQIIYKIQKSSSSENKQLLMENQSSPNKSQSTQRENREVYKEKKPSVDEIMAKQIVSRSYYWHEDGLSVSLSFQYEDNPNSGTMVLSGPTHTLSFRIDGDRSFVGAALYPNRPCSITYNYTIRGNYINADFVSSTCDYDGNGKNLVYDESRNSISIYTNEGEMILK